MSKQVIKIIMSIAVAVTLAALAGCGAQKPVCEGRPQHLAVVAMTSPSDLQTSRRLAPSVTDQTIAKVVKSCGTLTVGLVDDLPSNLVLHTYAATPKREKAASPKPVRRDMTIAATNYVRRYLLDPLRKQEATDDSPFFSVAAAIRDDLAAHHINAAAVALIGDGVFVDKAPSGAKADARTGSVSDATLAEFVPMLKGLPHCLMLVGSNLGSGLEDRVLRRAGAQFKATFAKAGVEAQMTPSDALPVC